MQITLAQATLIGTSPLFGMRLPTGISFKLARLAKLLQAELKTADGEREKLITACNGVLSEDKMTWTFGPDTKDAFTSGFNELMAATIDIGSDWPMPLSKLGNIELSAGELLQLDPLFTEE